VCVCACLCKYEDMCTNIHILQAKALTARRIELWLNASPSSPPANASPSASIPEIPAAQDTSQDALKVPAYICVNAYIHSYIHTYMHTYIYTHTLTYIHTYLHILSKYSPARTPNHRALCSMPTAHTPNTVYVHTVPTAIP